MLRAGEYEDDQPDMATAGSENEMNGFMTLLVMIVSLFARMLMDPWNP
jgi:hypothetical protein